MDVILTSLEFYSDRKEVILLVLNYIRTSHNLKSNVHTNSVFYVCMRILNQMQPLNQFQSSESITRYKNKQKDNYPKVCFFKKSFNIFLSYFSSSNILTATKLGGESWPSFSTSNPIKSFHGLQDQSQHHHWVPIDLISWSFSILSEFCFHSQSDSSPNTDLQGSLFFSIGDLKMSFYDVIPQSQFAQYCVKALGAKLIDILFVGMFVSFLNHNANSSNEQQQSSSIAKETERKSSSSSKQTKTTTPAIDTSADNEFTFGIEEKKKAKEYVFLF